MTKDEYFNNIDKFLLNLLEKELSENTIKQYTSCLNSFTKFILGTQVLIVDRNLVINFKNKLIKIMEDNKKIPSEKREGLIITEASTINIYIKVLNQFFKYLNRDDLVLKYIPERDSNIMDEILTDREFVRIINHADERTKLIMETLAYTGIRIGELSGITIESLKTRVGETVNKNKVRFIFIPKKLKRKLSQYANKNNITSGPIFLSKRGNPLSADVIRQGMKSAAGSARGISLDKVYPHSLRHLFSRRYARLPDASGLNLSFLLGHSIPNVTFGYIKPSRDILLSEIDRLEEFSINLEKEIREDLKKTQKKIAKRKRKI